MSEFGGLWKHRSNQHAFVPLKMECGCRSGGGIKNSLVRYPSYGGTQEKKKEKDFQYNRESVFVSQMTFVLVAGGGFMIETRLYTKQSCVV